MLSQELIWKLFIAFISSMGFALMFNLHKRWIIQASFGGLCSWGIYLFCQSALGQTVFIPCLIASIFSALYAYALAHYSEGPFTMFFLIAVVPLIPGSGLYYTIFNLVQGNPEQVHHFARMTAEFALAIAFGVSAVWAGLEIVNRYRKVHVKRSLAEEIARAQEDEK